MAKERKKHSSLLVLLICVLSVPTASILLGILPQLPPLQAVNEETLAMFKPYLLMGGILGLAHILLRPILRIVSAPLGCLTLGAFGFVIDIALIYLSTYLLNTYAEFSLAFPSLLQAAVTAFLINLLCAVTQSR
jgi:Membrane protein of unknown function.